MKTIKSRKPFTFIVLIVLIMTSLSCAMFRLLRPTHPEIGDKISTMHTIITYEGDARQFYISPEIIMAESINYYNESDKGVVTYQSDDISVFNGCVSIRNEGDWIQLETTGNEVELGVQFYGDYADGWARIFLDDEAIWQVNTHYENCPVDDEGNRLIEADKCKGGYIVYVNLENLSASKHTLRVVNAGGGETTVCFFGVGAAYPWPE